MVTPASPDLGPGPTNQQGPVPQTGSTTPTGQLIGPLPASTMPGQIAQTIPVMANFQFLLDAINNIIITGGGVTRIDTIAPILGGPIITTGTISHALSGVSPGIYGDSIHVAQIGVDAFGHVFQAGNVLIAGTGGGVSITATAPIKVTPSPLINVGVISHNASGVTPGTYGDGLDVSRVTFEVDGHATAASSVAIPIMVASGASHAKGLVPDPGAVAGITKFLREDATFQPVTGFVSNLFSSLWAYGDGSDGAFTLDGVAIPAWATLAGTTYTMTRDVYSTTLILNAGITLSTVGRRIFANTPSVTTGFAFELNGLISANGFPGFGATAGNGATGANWFAVGSQGGGGGNVGAGHPGIDQLNSGVAGAGGAGGVSGARAGGIGGAQGLFASRDGANKHIVSTYPTIMWGTCPSGAIIGAGAGGGGGAGDGATRAGGGGGGGAGIVGIFALTIGGTGAIHCLGGDGANGGPGGAIGCGGGGGGGGGAFLVITSTLNVLSLITVDLSGGNAGAGTVSAANGVNGAAGNIYFMATY